MKKNKHISYAIIPARAGSKGVPKKNIALLGGFPLIAYAIAAAKMTKGIDRVIVSTDSEEFAAVAKKFGAEVPFLRPASMSTDRSLDNDYILHALRWLQENGPETPDYLVQLRPTTPLRHPRDIEKASAMLEEHPEATALRSAHEIKESPFKLVGKEGDYFVGLFPNDPRPEYWNLPRQMFQPVYQPDGYVDIILSKMVLESNGARLHGDRTLAFLSPDTGEVDRPEDFKFIEYKLEKEHWDIYDYLQKNFR